MSAIKATLLFVALLLGGDPLFAHPTSHSRRAQPTQPSAISQPAQAAQASAPAQSSRPSATLQPAEVAQASGPAEPSQPTAPSQQLSVSPPSESALSPRSALSSPPRYSADGLYNLANSYARAGKTGLAVLNYERAALLAPNDPDIAANLSYVRTSAHVSTEPRNRFARIGQALSPSAAAWLAVVGIILVGAALLAKRVTPRLRWLRAAAVLLGVASIALTASNAMWLWPHLHDAVVLTNQTPALVSPVPMADTAFVLPEAETVAMTAKHDDYILVRTRAGLSGWVARASLGAVVP